MCKHDSISDKDKKSLSDDNFPDQIEGRNPVLEALKSTRTVNKLFISDKAGDKSIQKIIDRAKELGIPYVFTDRHKLDEISVTGHHQGVIAKASLASYSDMDDIFKFAEEKGEEPFVFVLDGIQDPHNTGAIIRTAHECGAHGVIISKRNSAGITPVAARAAAGASNHIHIVRVANIAQTIDRLKEKGLWFVCADMDGEIMYRQDLKGAVGLVIGNEGKGVSALVKKKCDFVTSIPMFGKVGSLNAAVAAGVLAYEIVRQRKYGEV